MKIYCLFTHFTYDYTYDYTNEDTNDYDDKELVCIFDNKELAQANLAKYENIIKRYKELVKKQNQRRASCLTTKEKEELDQLCQQYNYWIYNNGFYIKEYELNEIMKGYENVSC